ncbi:ROK family protein [Burkholderia contaminans]|uniref:ROK family protein n=1 Tax=Burkholderia contaminans TaxID=488447 RepID=UPI00069B2930|nr:ROK family protein [Burkholderia contaminans]MEB4636805.1 ROK family protein [Burkholderia contaminans]MEB4651652.1 ROK family protein [Burkholderia contaminans]MEB4661223.1 ROK family protein [Burkholderia contaminans]MEB4667167.1 ROK family protein [Burkholderia contaminans]MEB4678453.1 ROK family protein [Burkholderia contaminans]
MNAYDLPADRPVNASDDGFALAIDFGGTKIAMATTTQSGHRLHETEIPTLAQQGADAVMRRMFEAAWGLISRTVVTLGAPLRAVTAVTPGIIERDGIRLAPNNPGWERLVLADQLREGFGVECVGVETDVKAAALAEARCGALVGIDCGLYLNLGTGLAAAAVIGGKVLRGAHGAAGEIGYQLRGAPGEAPFADGGAPLEDFVSGRAIGDRASRMLGRTVTTREVFDLCVTDPQIAHLVNDALSSLSAHVANMVLLLDPLRVAVGGGMSRIPRVADEIRACLARAVPYPPEVTVSAFGHGAALRGAMVLAGDVWNARRPSLPLAQREGRFQALLY